MARKRASMRQGPLADLFRSTEESVTEDEVRITANTGAGAEVAVADQAQEVPGPVEVPEPGPEPVPEPTPDPVPEPTPDPQPEPSPPEPAAEVTVEKAPESYRETARPAHEGLQGLIGGEPVEIRPSYGREEPDTTTASKPPVPRTHEAVLRVVGVGGAGVNAVNRMIEAEIPGAEFVAINTDLQSLQGSNADVSLQIGAELTRGLGSGSDPRVGYRAAFEEQDKIKGLLKGSDMVFIAAGAGGGTGTGAAPVVARLARDVGALTVAAVSKPFAFEGARRIAQAEEGIAALGGEVDTLIVVPNEKLLQILERRTSIKDAFKVADDVLRQAVQGISDLVTLPGLINLDFADVRTTMLEAGDAILGIGMGVGEHRAILAAQKAVSSPLLDSSVEGAHSLLLSITGGPDLSLIEASEAAEIVREAAHPDANIIFGANVDEGLSEQVWVTVIATRFDNDYARRRRERRGRGEPRGDRGRDGGPTIRSVDRRAEWERRWAGQEHLGAQGRAEEPIGRDIALQESDRYRLDRREQRHRPGTGAHGGYVLDVPEFIPKQ